MTKTCDFKMIRKSGGVMCEGEELLGERGRGIASRVTGVMSGQPLLHLAVTTRLKLLWTFDKCLKIAPSWYFMMLIKCLRY